MLSLVAGAGPRARRRIPRPGLSRVWERVQTRDRIGDLPAEGGIHQAAMASGLLGGAERVLVA